MFVWYVKVCAEYDEVCVINKFDVVSSVKQMKVMEILPSLG